MTWKNHGPRWVDRILHVRGDGTVYTKWTLVVYRLANGYAYQVYDGSVTGDLVTTGTAPFRWLAQFLAGWRVPA